VLFTGRWIVHVLATRLHGRPVIPPLFWMMSMDGSTLLLCYFIWGKNDSVGILSNLFPMSVALYNLVMAQTLAHAGSDRLAESAVLSRRQHAQAACG